MSAATDPSRCLANECPITVAAPALMCEEHWAMVPAALRASLSATSRPGDASAEHLAYVAAARAEVAHKQRRRQGRTPRAASKPVQLPLFELGKGARK